MGIAAGMGAKREVHETTAGPDAREAVDDIEEKEVDADEVLDKDAGITDDDRDALGDLEADDDGADGEAPD